MRTSFVYGIAATATLLLVPSASAELTYPVVDTAQEECYDDRNAIAYTNPGEDYFGQDAQYRTNDPAYKDNGDGTVSDLVTGLMWTKDPGEKMTWADAMQNPSKCRVGGYDDWRLPNIKELYSLIQFDGMDPNPKSEDTSGLKPFIDRSAFNFSYGNPAGGERIIDSQFATSTIYTSTTMNANKTMFGVNFADGRIKGYPTERVGSRIKTYYVLYVRGNPEYGKNQFEDNGDGTITDHATSLTWTKTDSGKGMNWQVALKYAAGLELAGYSDWRLPNAKELQSIVDYTRSPDASDSAAIDPIFQATAIENEAGNRDFGWYWTSTSHCGGNGARAAVYVTFGRAGGFMGGRSGGPKRLIDVHGAGAQRSDPKSGYASRFPEGRGPQGDVVRIENLVRCVRGGDARRIDTKQKSASGPPTGDGKNSSTDAGDRFLQRFDQNQDGKVTQEEFSGRKRRFRIVDKDGNGIVTREEAAAAPPPPGRKGSDPQSPSVAGPRNPTEVRTQPQQETGNTPTAPGNAGHYAKPNIILILTDDMGWTGLSVRMDERIENSASDFYQTPRIARLAEQGMRFSRAYSPAAVCTPTRASILTGKTPAKLHITTPGRGGRPEVYQKLIGPRQLREFPTSETTVAEALKEAGYATAHLGKWHLPGSDPGEHGFDVHDRATGNDGPGAYEDPNPKDIFGITERAVTFMDNQVAAGRPFYLQLSHYAVHTPVLTKAESMARFEKLPPGKRHNNVGFAAMTYDLDTGIGTLLDKVDALGLAKTTYVVLMSDNGAAGGRRRPENIPLKGGKGGLYEGGIRVPLILRGPGIKPETICRESVVGYDLLPTFCGWAGVPPPDGIEGANLAPLLQERPDQFKRSEQALLFHYPHYGEGPRQVPQSAVILGDYKLIKDHESGALQLYNLAADLSEEHDLSAKEPVVFGKMENRLARRLAETEAQMPTPNPDYDPEETPTRQRGSGGKKGGGRKGS